MRRHPRMKPLHPPFTDFPIALWVMSFVFDLFSLSGDNTFVKVAFYDLAAGCAIAVVAAAAGIFDFTRIEPGHESKPLALVHAGLNVVALVIFCIETYARVGNLGDLHTPVPLIVLSAIGVAFVLTSGYLGGRLVYDLGVNVRALAPTDRTVDVASTPREAPPRRFVRPPPPPPNEPMHP